MKLKKPAVILLSMIMAATFAFPAFAEEKIESVTLTVVYDTIYDGDDDSSVKVEVDDGEKYRVESIEGKNMGENGWEEGDTPRVRIELSADDGYKFSGAAAVPSGVNIIGDAEAVSASRANSNETLYITIELNEVEHDDDTWEEDDDDSSGSGGTPGTVPGGKSGSANPNPGSGPVVNTTDGKWIKDATGWWYRNSDNSYTVYNWQFINYKWYFFDTRGYMEASKWINWKNKWYYVGYDGDMWIDKRTPDGYYVGTDGVWIQGK